MGFAQRVTFLSLSALFIVGLGLLAIETLSDGSALAVAESGRDGLAALASRIADQIP